jgi:hypothetical protein
MKLTVAFRMPRSAIGAENRSSRHDCRLGAERDRLAAGEIDQLDAVQGDRPLVGRGHRDPATERLPDVSEARLAVRRGASGDLHENVGVRRAKALQGGRPAPRSRQLRDRPPLGHQSENVRNVESVFVVDEPVACVREAHHGNDRAVARPEAFPVRMQGAEKPLAHGPEADHPDPDRSLRARDA